MMLQLAIKPYPPAATHNRARHGLPHCLPFGCAQLCVSPVLAQSAPHDERCCGAVSNAAASPQLPYPPGRIGDSTDVEDGAAGAVAVPADTALTTGETLRLPE
jgi:hypothetical protein